MKYTSFVLCGISLLSGVTLFADGAGEFSGGATTVMDASSHAYTHPASNLTQESLNTHTQGDATFEAVFVSSPARVNGGLGAKFNNVSCMACHLGDGRGLPIIGSKLPRSQALIRVSLPEGIPSSPGGQVPFPGIGLQIRDHAIIGSNPDAKVDLKWVELPPYVYGDGASCKLRKPSLTISLLDGSLLPSFVQTSFRIAPPIFGLGLLEAVAEETIRAFVEEGKKEGLSGHMNHVWDSEKNTVVMGRFGWKANTANLLQQAAAAYYNDMGVTTYIHPENDGSVEVSKEDLLATTFYTQTLAVPARRASRTASQIRGEKLFQTIHCGSCHIPTMQTGEHSITELKHQTIHPFTDLLVHDMGSALADGRPDFEASENEWRTAPLWGIGLTKTVHPGASFLHDGRARSLEEAILWHGGEAQLSHDQFVRLTALDRAALLDFLNTL
jgi:CxxC motif-containing protein (DUF1111 family)